MLLGLCSSFAVVPMFSLVEGGGGAPRRLAGPVSATPEGSPEGLGSLLIASAAWSAVSAPSARSGAVALDVPVEPAGASTPAHAAAPSVSAAHGAPVPVPAPALARTPAPSPSAALPNGPAPAPVAGSPPAVHSVPHAAGGSRVQGGIASWLDIIPTGTCANNAAPMGAVLTVNNGAGVSVTCTVVSRGPFGPGRVIDLAKATFARLSPTSAGLVAVTVTW